MAAKTVIRPAAEADIPAILALYRQLDSALVAMQPEFFCEGPREEDEIRKAIRADDADFCWRRARRRSCRLCAGRLRGLTPELSCVFAPPLCAAGGSGRGRGRARAGRRQRAFGRRRRLGTQPALGVLLELNVLAQNENAIRLYESQDFCRGDEGYAVYAVTENGAPEELFFLLPTKERTKEKLPLFRRSGRDDGGCTPPRPPRKSQRARATRTQYYCSRLTPAPSAPI